MELYLKISNINDFIFCPLSIYYHELYGELKQELYYAKAQLDGKAAHETIDEKRYSTHKTILQGIDVYSDEYKLMGKIDIFDTEKAQLTERKKQIKVIYDGYVFQLYAQCLCLREMGYAVKSLRCYSLTDNKVYPIQLPEDNSEMFEKFKTTICAMQSFDIATYTPQSPDKCSMCIYNDFCDRPLASKKIQ
ncbi:MAG: type V CRISPR-associated protein Cas4 [Spirochaetaceae bacterium]|nr:type V CRISPR-associated protein Cas4 [Spirochaetaceae bacterium]